MSRYQVFETFQDIVLVLDRDGKVVFGNGAAAILLETSPRRLTSSRPITQFVVMDPDPLAMDGGLDALKETGQMKEVAFSLPDGKTGFVQATLQPQPDFFATGEEDRDRWILSMRDVTLEKVLHTKYRGEIDQKEVVIDELRQARAALEEYSRELEKKVEARTAEIRGANRLQKTILDSLGQGILVFDRTGNCLPIFSQVCRRLLGTEPTGKGIAEVLALDPHERSELEIWRDTVFEELLDFEDMVPLCPVKSKRMAGLELSFDYYPMRGEDGVLNGIVVVATDRTEELKALRKAQAEQELVSRVTQVARNRDAFRVFVSEARRLLGELSRPQRLDFEDVARRLHTIKGGAASFSLGNVAVQCHQLENEIKLSEKDRPRLDRLVAEKSPGVINLIEKEVVTLTDLLGPLASADEQIVELPLSKVNEWADAVASAATIEDARLVGARIAREGIERPVANAIRHIEPSLRELALSYGKKLDKFEIKGADTRVPPKFADALLASLVHAFRNSVYHGLEQPHARRALGKPEGGSIMVNFSRRDQRSGAWLTIEISDDGKGVDPEAIRNKLLAMGRDDVAKLPDAEVIQAILRDEVTTNEKVDLIAGRGVGMSAITSEATKLGGAVRVSSVPGQGMRLTILVPIPKAAPVAKAA